MIRLTTPLTQIDTVAVYELGSRVQDKYDKEYIYLTGVASTLAGSWVTYDEVGITALLATGAKGPVAVAVTATNTTSKFGWYYIWGSVEARMAANTAADATIGRETSDGLAGDGHIADDQIYGAISRDATTTAAVVTVQLNYPVVTEKGLKFVSASQLWSTSGNSHAVTDSKVTAASAIVILHTSAYNGRWHVTPAAGSFTITSSDSEPATTTTFKYLIL